MATIPFSKIQSIIKLNPNKSLIQVAKTQADNLMMQVYGVGLENGLQQYGYFESKAIYSERKQGAISNQDLFERILKREEMVWSAQGGSITYEGLTPAQTLQFDSRLDSIRYHMSIRKWVKEFALNAYRTDPMSVLFIEVSEDGTQIYPTYKSIACIYDYSTTGRKVEYIAFSLTVSDCIAFGISDPDFDKMQPQQVTNYYRFVDDAFDYIVKNTDGVVTEISNIANQFKQVPAIVTSDLINFTNPAKFSSPLDRMLELATNFLNDRSIRNLSKKLTGFPKVIEPLVQCGKCSGTGYLSGAACPDCTLPGQSKGTGYKLETMVSDVLRIPIGVDDKFKWQDYFGYASPDIKIWDKQDTSLNDLENFMTDTYWGTVNRVTTTGPTQGKEGLDSNKTATQVIKDERPEITRLNLTADWAQDTENALCDLIGQYLYPGSFVKSQRTLGRYYILETPNELLENYLNAKGKGSPQATLNELLSKYNYALYMENKIKLAVALKLMAVEPFVHYKTMEVETMNPARIDFVCKMYFSEWLQTLQEAYLIVTPATKMVSDLVAYAQAKAVLQPELLIAPTVGVTDTIKSAQ